MKFSVLCNSNQIGQPESARNRINILFSFELYIVDDVKFNLKKK